MPEDPDTEGAEETGGLALWARDLGAISTVWRMRSSAMLYLLGAEQLKL